MKEEEKREIKILKNMNEIKNNNIPVLESTDILIVESSLAGCVAAIDLARAGKNVVLCSSGFSLPEEIVLGIRPWVTDSELLCLPEYVKTFLESCVKDILPNGDRILHVGKVSDGFEDLLIESGVKFYYGMNVCGIMQAKNNLTGVVFAGKAGIQAIKAYAIIDCTEFAQVAQLTGGELTVRKPNLESIKITLCCLSKGGNIDLINNSVAFTNGRVDFYKHYAEFSFKIQLDYNHPFLLSEVVLKSRKALLAAGKFLVKKNKDLSFYRMPDFLFCEPLVRIKSEKEHCESVAQLCQLPASNNLWICSGAIDVDNEYINEYSNFYKRVQLGLEINKFCLNFCEYKNNRFNDNAELIVSRSGNVSEFKGSSIFVNDLTPLHSSSETIEFNIKALPILSECDVLVAGAGTSGVPAAITAQRNNAKTILTEAFSDLGGTKTIGGISRYWFGYDTEFCESLDREYHKLEIENGMPTELAMLSLLQKNNVSVLPKCVAAGVIMENETLKGIIVVTAQGLAVIKAKIVIDATGDADIAAWTGSPYEYGTSKDALTMYSSFGKFIDGFSEVNRHYQSVVDIRDAADLSRAIITSRRRSGIFDKKGDPELPQHYFTSRESRRIIGEKQVTYGGILSGETFEDVAFICKSNFDIKGIASSNLIRCGYVSWDYNEEFTCAIPYAALIPKHRNNLFVIGKAYSVSHDALTLARMQKDLIAMGGAVGIAAAHCVKNNTKNILQIDMLNYQKQLIKAGILTEENHTKWSKPKQLLSIDNIIEKMQNNSANLQEKVTLLNQGSSVILRLQEAFKESINFKGKKNIAIALCYLKDETGVSFLVDVIKETIKENLPITKKQLHHPAPDHGWIQEPATMIYAISLTSKHEEIAGVSKMIAEKIKDNIDCYHDLKQSEFEYVLSICLATERSSSPKMIPALKTLLSKSSLKNLVLHYGADPRKSINVSAERRAYLELAIGRSLAKCGDLKGVEILKLYKNDMRGFLSRSAYDALSLISE